MRFTLPYGLYKFMGITSGALLIYIVVIGVFGGLSVTRLLPIELASDIQRAWPRMPFFSATKGVDENGNQVIYYTVPSRQLTPQEIARMENVKKPSDLQNAKK